MSQILMSLDVKLQRFHQWFDSRDDDLKTIQENEKPKPEKLREQNKKATQGSRKKWTPKQKFDFIREYDCLREEDSSLTQKQFCDSRSHLNENTFGKWLKPMERKKIEIDFRKMFGQ